MNNQSDQLHFVMMNFKLVTILLCLLISNVSSRKNKPRIKHHELHSAIEEWVTRALPTGDVRDHKLNTSNNENDIFCHSFESHLVDVRVPKDDYDLENTFYGINFESKVKSVFDVTLNCSRKVNESSTHEFRLCTKCFLKSSIRQTFNFGDKTTLKINDIRGHRFEELCGIDEERGHFLNYFSSSSRSRFDKPYEFCSEIDDSLQSLISQAITAKTVSNYVYKPLSYTEEYLTRTNNSVVLKALRLLYLYKFKGVDILTL